MTVPSALLEGLVLVSIFAAPASARSSRASSSESPITSGMVRLVAMTRVTASPSGMRTPDSGSWRSTLPMASSAGSASMTTSRPFSLTLASAFA